MTGIGDLTILVSANIEAFQSAFQSVAQTLDKIGDQVEKLMDKFEGMGARMAAAGSELSAAVSAPIIAMGADALETAAKFEQTEIAFTHFIGSAQGAKDYLKQLYDFAANTPFQIQDITGGAQKLMAMGFSAQQVIPMLKAMGDQLSAVGRMDMLPNLILAFGELKEGGVASMRALRQMVMDGVIPALKYMAEAAGVSAGEMRKQIMHGAVDSEAAMKTILAGMARDTGGLMAQEMSSYSGMMTNVKDNITYTLNAIGQQLLPVAKTFADFATKVLDQVKVVAQAFGNLPEPVRMFGLALAGVAAAAGPLLVLIGGLTFGLAALNIAFAPIAGLIGISTAALGGYVAVTGVVIAAVAALAYETKTHWAAIKAVTVQAFQGISEMAHAIFGPLIEFLENMFRPVAAAMVNVWTLVKGELSAIWNSIRADAEYIWGKVVSAIHMVVTAARLIPGVNKLLGLGEAWESAEKLAQSANKAAVAVHMMGTELNGLSKSGAAAPEVKTEFKPVVNTDMLKEIEFHAALVRMRASYAQFVKDFSDGKLETESLRIGDALERLSRDGKKSLITLDEAMKLIKGGSVPLDKLKSDFETLGVTSSASLEKQAEAAKNAYEELMKYKDVLHGDELRDAWIAMQEAAVKAADAMDKPVAAIQRLDLAITKLKKDWSEQGGISQIFSKNAFDAFQSGFNKTIENLLNGTQKFRNAWITLGRTMVESITSSMAQVVSHYVSQLALMLARWAAHQAQTLIIKHITDASIVTSHAATAAKTQGIDIVQQIKNVMAAAKTAAANTWAAVSAIPIVGPILAPPAAAAAFAGVMALGAVSAEGGAVLPNYNTIGLLHPREMVLPAHISTGLQNMIANGGGNGGIGTMQQTNHMTTNMNYKGRGNLSRSELAGHSRTLMKVAATQIRNNALPRK